MPNIPMENIEKLLPQNEKLDAPLPCPFCGDTEVSVSEGSTFRWRVAVCDNCGAQASEVRHNTLAEDQKAAENQSTADAISAWNIRSSRKSRSKLAVANAYPPKPTYEQLEAEVFALREQRVNQLADAGRVIAWINDPKRKPAVLAFTEGNERQIAYRFESLLRGEYICPECGLRKDSEPALSPDF